MSWEREYTLEKAKMDFAQRDMRAYLMVKTDDIVVIDWRRSDGSSEYSVRYYIDLEEGRISIGGDLGSCVACWHNRLTLCDLQKFMQNVSYWTGKIQCTDSRFSFDWEDARKDLEELKEEYEDYIDDEDWEDVVSEIEECGYNDDGVILSESAIEVIEEIDQDWWEGSWISLGRSTNPLIYLWSMGLKMAYEQLKERGEVE